MFPSLALGDDRAPDSAPVYTFERANTGIGSQSAKLIGSDGAANDEFGYGFSLSGGTALVGTYDDADLGDASGSAYIFETISVPAAEAYRYR